MIFMPNKISSLYKSSIFGSLLAIFVNKGELLKELTLREIRQRYKQSILGYAWVILNPFSQMLVMSFVFSKLIIRDVELGVPYSLFVYLGLLPWTLFAGSLSSSASVLIDNSGLLKKIYFPREIFIISTIMAKLVDFFLASSIFVVFMIYFKIPLTINVVFFIPILFIQLLLTFGLSLIISAVNLFYRDIQYLLNLVLLVWMYLTPVIYAVEFFPVEYRFIFQLNPMAVFINAYRSVILSGELPNFLSLLIGFLSSLFIVFIGYSLFKKLEGMFADVV